MNRRKIAREGLEMPGKQRVQFDFTQESYDRIKVIQESTGASTLAEVLRESLKYYEWLLDLVGNNPANLEGVVQRVNDLMAKEG
jgi:hypothetical protein